MSYTPTIEFWTPQCTKEFPTSTELVGIDWTPGSSLDFDVSRHWGQTTSVERSTSLPRLVRRTAAEEAAVLLTNRGSCPPLVAIVAKKATMATALAATLLELASLGLLLPYQLSTSRLHAALAWQNGTLKYDSPYRGQLQHLANTLCEPESLSRKVMHTRKWLFNGLLQEI